MKAKWWMLLVVTMLALGCAKKTSQPWSPALVQQDIQQCEFGGVPGPQGTAAQCTCYISNISSVYTQDQFVSGQTDPNVIAQLWQSCL